MSIVVVRQAIRLAHRYRPRLSWADGQRVERLAKPLDLGPELSPGQPPVEGMRGLDLLFEGVILHQNEYGRANRISGEPHRWSTVGGYRQRKRVSVMRPIAVTGDENQISGAVSQELRVNRRSKFHRPAWRRAGGGAAQLPFGRREER